MARRPEQCVLLLMVAGDPGLCGAVNANVIRRTLELLRERSQQKIELIGSGKKGRDALRKRNRSFVAEYINVTTRVEYPQAKDIAQKVIELYSSGETDAVYAVYNEFKNVMTQKRSEERLLPIEPESFQIGRASCRERV